MTEHKASTQEMTILAALASGPMRAADLVSVGGSGTAISRLLETGRIERLGRGVYRLADAVFDARESWAALATRVPSAVFCLVSAASFHGITQEMATGITIAVPHALGTTPRFPEVSLEVLRWRNQDAFEIGVEEHVVAGVRVQITSPARTVVDLFRTSSLNPGCHPRAVKTTPETFLDAMFRFLDPERGLDDQAELARIAVTFGVLDYIQAYVQTANFAGPGHNG